MADLKLIIVGMGLFTFIVVILTFVVEFARGKLVAGGKVKLIVNGDEEHPVQLNAGGKLLTTLADQHIFLPSACGGGGTCGECRVIVLSGGGNTLDTERGKLTRKQIHDGYRLSCQVVVKRDLAIELPADLAKVEKWPCKVRSNRGVATFIKELVLELPTGVQLDFRAGGYILLEAPPHRVKYTDFDIEQHFRQAWDRFDLWRYESIVTEPVSSAYSMANYPDEKGIVMLNVRINSPPPRLPDVPPGRVSSYIFNLKPGDKVTISGPYGQFFARNTDNEMIFVGGGSGMAPMRSHIFDQLKRLRSKRRISFWYGARSLAEVFYQADFDGLAKEHRNFNWTIGLSDPQPEDHWQGATGFIHQILYDRYLKDHPAPEDCEYYLCGPPPMLAALEKMLYDVGVDAKNIMFDKFG
ncbi:MAG: NADH:ubiquinone reductase (Na(+)-transporting) subunit F [Gammaproteobacteria bacterium]